MNLAEVTIGKAVTIKGIGGYGTFRLRLLELGLLPNTEIIVILVAPFGDPIEILVRGGILSIRLADAKLIEVWWPAQ